MTSLHIGGNIKYIYYPNNKISLALVYKEIIKKQIKYFIIGRGTNILVSDEDFIGIVISLKMIDQYYIIDNNHLSIDAGCNFKTLFELTKKGIGGFEELACIPGSIGGLIYQNASFKGVTIKDKLTRVECIDKLGNIIYLDKQDLDFNYRSSIFKNKEYIILSGVFCYNSEADIHKIYNYLMEKKKTQPLNLKNAGSTFKNVGNIPAWRIIREIGADKFKVNDAAVSEKHANFLVNLNNSSFLDMYTLILKIKEEAKKNNYDLELEIEIINR